MVGGEEGEDGNGAFLIIGRALFSLRDCFVASWAAKAAWHYCPLDQTKQHFLFRMVRFARTDGLPQHPWQQPLSASPVARGSRQARGE